MLNDFAIFVLTHGRPDKQLTWELLKKLGYTGKIYLVLDDQDKTIPQYIQNFGAENIFIFDKNHYVQTTDTGNNKPVFGCGIYARNAIEDIAKEMGLKAFVQADDDILNMRIRFPEADRVRSYCINSTFDSIIYAYIEFIKSTNFAYIGFGNAPAYMCGKEVFNINNSNFPYVFMLRNSRVDVKWSMNFSDDYATPTLLSNRGNLCLQIPFVQVDESPVADVKTTGGMANSYARETELSLAFYIKMSSPNSVALTYDGEHIKLTRHGRKVRPKIISGGYKK